MASMEASAPALSRMIKAALSAMAASMASSCLEASSSWGHGLDLVAQLLGGGLAYLGLSGEEGVEVAG